MPRRIHILGASGTGTSTLARGLATALHSQVFDTDDFFWRPTDPPFTDKRPAEERVQLMQELFLPRADWILSGSATGWGDALIPFFTHVIYLTTAAPARLARLRQREQQRYGAQIQPGGAREAAHHGFLDWAMGYDNDGFTGRSRRRHEAWMLSLPCPVIRLDADQAAEAVLARALAALS